MNMRIGGSGKNHNIGPIGNKKEGKKDLGAMKAHTAALGALEKGGATNRTASASMKAGGHTAKLGSEDHAGSVTKRLFN